MGLEKLNKMRKAKGIGLEELSQKSGVPKSTLSKITSGQTTNPNLETIRAIVYAMGYTLDDLETYPDIKGLPPEIMTYVDKYRMLDKYGKELVKIVIDKEYRRCYEQMLNDEENT